MIFEYFKWHYGRGFTELITLSRNFTIFFGHFFSLKLLFSTLFSPWKRMGEEYALGFHIESFLFYYEWEINRSILLNSHINDHNFIVVLKKRTIPADFFEPP